MENTENKNIYSVSRLNTEVRQVIEGSFPLVWVEGEISNLSTPRSGHMYFSLKDAHAQTRCAMFRMKRQLLRFLPAEGMQVLVRARITLYEARGDFQLVIEHMEAAGEGQLRQAIEQLKNRLNAEGLFAPAHKKDLPTLPRTVGVVTSPSGAAITDILHVFKRRFPGIRIIIYPVAVQGDKAAVQISQMLKLADKRNECDLLILARGGGSLEDLMAFNDEQLARTIYALNTPIISAVGHEIDTSISDFVADRRAPTPSAAAELASPDQLYLQQQIEKLSRRFSQAANSALTSRNLHYRHLQQRLALQSPARQLLNKSQTLDLLENRLLQLAKRTVQQQTLMHTQLESRLQQASPIQQIASRKTDFNNLVRRLEHSNPQVKIIQNQEKVTGLQKQLHQSVLHVLSRWQEKLHATGRMLESVSPLATLSRGYAIVKDNNDNIVKTVSEVKAGQQVVTHLSDGKLHCKIESIEEQ